MPPKITAAEATYYLGFDGGGTKTECVLADADGNILSKASAGPSNPIRAGYTKAWFSLSEAADLLLSRQKITASHVRGLCAGLGGASRAGVGRRASIFFEHSFPNANVRVTSDLEIALEAAFGSGEGVILLGGTGSAALGRDGHGRTVRVGGRGPWFSDEGSAYDIGRQAVRAVSLAEEKRGPATALSKRLFAWHESRDWESLIDRISKNPDDVFPKTFPLVAQAADAGDEVARNILGRAAGSLAELAAAVSKELGWQDQETSVAKVGGVFGRSKYFDEVIESEMRKALPHAHLVSAKISPAEAAVQIAIRLTRALKEMQPDIDTLLGHARPAFEVELKHLMHARREAALERRSLLEIEKLEKLTPHLRSSIQAELVRRAAGTASFERIQRAKDSSEG